MAKEKLTAAEWELVKDAPLWVNAVLWAGDKKGMAGTDKREAEALERTLKNYRTTNALIRDILNDDSEPADKVKKATKAEAEVALGRIASIVEAKVGADDLDAVNEFLLQVGRNVAEAASENALGLGQKVSKHESAALNELEVLLRATDAQKKARRDNALKEQAAAATTAKQQADAKAKADQARQEAEAKATAEEAKKDAAAKERLEKARAELGIGQSLEAAVSVTVPPALKPLMASAPETFWADLCIVSAFSCSLASDTSKDTDEVEVAISRVEGDECPRCWKDSSSPEGEEKLCPRCGEGLRRMEASA